ncbi:uncharacterized protein [Epargyreus clarus]|uniref:uncharacterized protein n=1 Tax=Epargyreus clarus TaxID=520877 RepID=UPI003C302686
MLEFQGIIICIPLYSIAILLLGASITAGLFVFHVAVVPLIFKYSKTFRRNLIFANAVQWPLHVDFEEPASSGVEGGRNFSIEYASKVDQCHVKIGVWHILPKSAYERLKGSFESNADHEHLTKLMDSELANSKTPIVLYCHGNSNSRAASHRVMLYQFFQQMDFHTIAFDYRGYGDSTNIRPSEAGVVEDALVVYDWLRTAVDVGDTKPPLYVWGHSLGTGISSHLLGNLEELSRTYLERSEPLPLPNGLILEAPFNNLADEVAKHPLSKLVTWLPYYETTFVEPFKSCKEHEFKSDTHLSRAKQLPILILHAKDDIIVPFIVGLKLYRSILQSRVDGGATIKLHAYDKKQNLGHKYICTANDLPEVIGEFVKSHHDKISKMVFGVILVAGASLTACVLLVQVAVLPLLFRYSKTVQRKMVFANCINYPRNTDFENPSSCNVMGGRNFCVDFESKVDNCPVKIGVWHIVPSSQFQKLFVVRDYADLDSRLHEELKSKHNTIVLYCHGNSSHRGTPHRLQMYKVFQELNYHVITFDYRGYGDSTHLRPTEKGVVEDTFHIYSWLMNTFDDDKKPTVILWGHSIGTSIASNLVSHMRDLCYRAGKPCLPLPDALVLEAPFNNLAEEIEKHPFSKLVSWLPYYKESFVKPYTKSSEYTLTTDQYLISVTDLPILILHSKTDKIVPFELGVKLHECIAESRRAGGACLEFHEFDRGHINLYESPDLPGVVQNFVRRIQEK